MATRFLVYQVSKSNKQWQFKLCAREIEDNHAKSDGSFLCEEISEGVASFDNESGKELLRLVPELTAYLQSALQKCHDEKGGQSLTISFRDEIFLRQPYSENSYKAAVDIPNNNGGSQMPLFDDWAVYVLFSSLYLGLSSFPEHTAIIRLYAAWQRFNLIKKLIDASEERKKASKSVSPPFTERVESLLLSQEFASAYRELSNLLLDETNSYAGKMLWTVGHEQKKQKPPDISDPRIRQCLRLSMPFAAADQSRIDSPQPRDFIAPLPARDCFEGEKTTSASQKKRLHGQFQKKENQNAIRRLVSDELLPQYNLKESLLLLSQLTRVNRLGNFLGYCGQASKKLIPIVAILFFFFTTLLVIRCSEIKFVPYILPVLEWLPYWLTFLGGLYLISLLGLGLRGSIALLLPRITGGIVIGYFPLLIATEPWYLALYASRHHYTWCLEWGFILAISEVYLYREAYPFVLEGWEAFRRSFKVLVWATVQAVLIGFLLIMLSAPVYRQLTYNEQRIDFQPHKEDSANSKPEENSESKKSMQIEAAQALQDLQKDSPDRDKKPDANKPVETGLDYRIPIHLAGHQTEFPVSVLLTFAPISLLLGIILQILWEEKPVTASVWPSESR